VAAPAPLHGRNASRSRYRSTPSLPLGFVNGTGRNRRRHQTVREDLGLKELLDALTFVGHPPSDEHQRLHLLVPSGGVGHDRAAIGVAD
jgi:hypothetical protein